ncbi:MAG: hypothetical protein ACXVLQ_16225, partial [Bacteriovorax sp.]
KNISLKELVSQLKFENLALANSSLAPSSTNNIRNSIGLAIGFSDNTAYGELACGGSIPAPNTDCTNAPPYNGIVGRLTDIINTLPTIGESVGISSCDQVPSSGSATGTDGNGNTVTVNFKTPTHTIPTPWLHGGATFQKRVEFTETILGESTKLAYEFNCGDSPASYIAINMDMGTIDSHAYARRIAVYTGPVDLTKKGIEVYMAEYSAGSSRLRAADAVRIEYLPATSEYYLWGVVNTNISGGNLVARAVLHGNYNTSKATFLYSGRQGANLAGNDSAIDIATVNGGGAYATAVDLTNGTAGAAAFDFAADLSANSGEVYKKGCVDFSSPNTAPANNNDCAGLALATTAAAPYADATGAFSIQWALSTMPTKLEVLP